MRQGLCILPDFTESGYRASEFVARFSVLSLETLRKQWREQLNEFTGNSLSGFTGSSLLHFLSRGSAEEKGTSERKEKNQKQKSIKKPFSPWLTEKSAFTLE